MAGTLFFDGGCGMCTRARNVLLTLNRTGQLQTEPLQRPDAAERLGVAAARLGESVWWLDSSGQVYAGAEACNAGLGAALGTRIPLRIYRIPGIAAVQDAVYRWVAAHRHRFPGTMPYCESDPLGCGSA